MTRRSRQRNPAGGAAPGAVHPTALLRWPKLIGRNRLIRLRLRESILKSRDFPATGHRDRMAPGGTALSGDQVVKTTPFVKVRCFREPQIGALENIGSWPDQFAFQNRVLLQNDACEAIVAGAVVPQLVHMPFAAVVIMEERRIEPAAVKVYRV